MDNRFVEWRLSLLTALGLGAVLGCGGATSELDSGGGGAGAEASGGAGAEASGGTSSGGALTTAGMSTRGGEGGRFLVAGSGGVSVGGSGQGGGGQNGIAGSTGGAGAGGVGKEWECVSPERSVQTAPQDRIAPERPEPAPLVTCEGGWVHRVRASTCPSQVPRAEEQFPEGVGSCQRDADCTAKPLGFCAVQGQAGAICQYGCTDDSQCGEGTICVCGNPVGRCMSASCSTDADCESGLCAGTPASLCGGNSYVFACAKAEDQCLSDAQCKAGEYCQTQGAARRCAPAPICGRPFLVGDEARLAEPHPASEGWQSLQVPELSSLDDSERRELAAHWTSQGLMEHASVAAFARFMLELLALGAPAKLVADTQRALGDEIAHAEACLGLATAYGGQRVGPSALPTQGALDGRTRLEIVKTAFAEACVGETLAAVEARFACERARDPEVRRALERIAEDEARHAELGWRFVQWALETSQLEVAAELRRELWELVMRETSRTPVFEELVSNERLADHGRLSEAARWAARRVALDELVLPWARALLGFEPGARAAA